MRKTQRLIHTSEDITRSVCSLTKRQRVTYVLFDSSAQLASSSSTTVEERDSEGKGILHLQFTNYSHTI